MNALVTGATGFLGMYIVEQLVARGDSVRAFCRHGAPELQSLGVEIAQGDIRDSVAVSAACRGVDTVFHTAAVAGIWGPWQTVLRDQHAGHADVSCRLPGTPRAPAGLHEQPQRHVRRHGSVGVDEAAPYARRWLCHYPHTKALAEQECWPPTVENGLLTVHLRPHLIWGPRDRHLIPRLIERHGEGNCDAWATVRI